MREMGYLSHDGRITDFPGQGVKHLLPTHDAESHPGHRTSGSVSAGNCRELQGADSYACD